MIVPEQFRVQVPPRYLSRPGDPFGVFFAPPQKAPGRRGLKMIATNGIGENPVWEHVSVSVLLTKTQTPTWAEMCYVKSLFWHPTEWVVQYHPAEANYVNDHPGVLHLWKPADQGLPIPPQIFV